MPAALRAPNPPQVVQRMMGAFEGRCAQLYGPSSLRTPGPVSGAPASPS